MNIEFLPVSDIQKNKSIISTKQIEKKYTILTPILISWVKIETNLTLESAKGEVNGDDNEYYINDNYFIVNDSSKQVNVTVLGIIENIYLSNELTYDISYPTFQNEIEMVNLTLTNNIPATIEIEEISIRVNENYVLTEDNFVKTRLFANGNGNIRYYEQDGSTLHLLNTHLYENASGTISLILTKQ